MCKSLDLVSIDIKNIWLELGNITGNSDNEKIIDGACAVIGNGGVRKKRN